MQKKTSTIQKNDSMEAATEKKIRDGKTIFFNLCQPSYMFRAVFKENTSLLKT